MNGDDREFIEATRLVLKFFPEANGFISAKTGLDWDAFLGAMMNGKYKADHSCDPCRQSSAPDLGLVSKGGLEGDGDEVYRRLLEHTGILPQGRAVVIPNAIPGRGWALEDCRPFVCHSKTVSDRMREDPCFGENHDTILVFESGEAILIDHDERVHWAESRIRNRKGRRSSSQAGLRGPA